MTASLRLHNKSSVTTNEQIRLAVARIAECDCPVLIVGENGAGKRSTAELIYALSHRCRSPFKEISCVELDQDSLISILETDATFYLNEVSNLAIPLQKVLLSEFLRSSQSHICRLLFGSSRQLRDSVKSWSMIEEFYYLISTVTLHVPPLRCRKSELLPLADELLTQYAKQFDRPKPQLGKEVNGFLLEHPWPGNLVEFRTAIKTFVAIEDQAISFAAIRAAAPYRQLGISHGHLSLKDAARAASSQIERLLISEVLVETGGNRKRAAEELGISYKALLYKLKQIETSTQSAINKNGAFI